MGIGKAKRIKFHRGFFTRPLNILLVAVLFGIIGVATLLLSSALSQADKTIQPQLGTVQGNAQVDNDASASAGISLTFGVCPSGTTGVAPNCVSAPQSQTWWSGDARPFSATSPFNTPTPANTTWYNMPAVMKTFNNNGTSVTRDWFVAPTNVWYAKSTDPFWTFTLPEYVYVPGNRNRPATTFTVQAPANMMDDGSIDHILMLVSGTKYYEVWAASVDQANRTVTNLAGSPGYAIGDILTDPGAGTKVGDYTGASNDGTRAANFSWIGGLITGYDLQVGKIDHALAIALTLETLKGGKNTGFPFRAPATSNDWGYASGPIEMGTKIGIPAGVAKPSGLSTTGNMIFDALQKYGAYVGDYAGGPYPVIYQDENSVPANYDWCTTFCANNEFNSKIMPLLKIADYQP